MLDIHDLDKSYPSPQGLLPILTKVTLSLAAGEAAAIMGPSGSGKSTFLYIVGTLERPTAGTVLIEGRNPFELGERDLATFRNRTMGFMFQDHCLLPQCTVLENVLTPTLVGAFDDSSLSRAKSLVDRVGLGHRLEHRPAALSGGEKQRVALARALVNQPRLLLCDEPTGNLNHRSAELVAVLLAELQREQGTTLLIATHSPELARRFPRRFELVDAQLKERL